MRTSAIAIIFGLIVTPAIALPGPLRLAEAKLPIQSPTQRTAREYVDNTAMSDLFEVASARLALQKSQSAEIRKFATMMIESHTVMSRDLKTALTGAAIHPLLPTALDNAHSVLMTQLKGANGMEFDTRYIQQQVDAHELALELQQSYARSGEDASLKHFAADSETKIALHLAEAQKISHSLGSLQPRA